MHLLAGFLHTLPSNYPRKLPAELQKSFGGVRYASVWPCQEVELSNGPGLSGFQILQIKASYQVIVAPYVFAHQMHLKIKTKKADTNIK